MMISELNLGGSGCVKLGRGHPTEKGADIVCSKHGVCEKERRRASGAELPGSAVGPHSQVVGALEQGGNVTRAGVPDRMGQPGH